MRNWIAAILVFAMAAGSLADETRDSLEQKSFTFHDKPIHPGVISEFDAWMSDSDPPRVKTVDLQAGQTSNKNSAAPQASPDGFLTCNLESGWFSYKHLGVTSSGTHVLIVHCNTGGTLVAEYVSLVRFDKEEYSFFKKGKREPTVERRVVLKCIGQIVLGDRDNGSVELKDDVLTLGTSKYRDTPVAYKLP